MFIGERERLGHLITNWHLANTINETTHGISFAVCEISTGPTKKGVNEQPEGILF